MKHSTGCLCLGSHHLVIHPYQYFRFSGLIRLQVYYSVAAGEGGGQVANCRANWNHIVFDQIVDHYYQLLPWLVCWIPIYLLHNPDFGPGAERQKHISTRINQRDAEGQELIDCEWQTGVNLRGERGGGRRTSSLASISTLHEIVIGIVPESSLTMPSIRGYHSE